jgi:hypothetical protein
MASLNSFYIRGRYSEEIEEIHASLSEKSATEIFKKTESLFLWLKNQMH